MQVLHDIDCLTAEININYLNHVLGLLASCPGKVQELVKLSIEQGVKLLKHVTPTVMETIVDGLAEKSAEVSFFGFHPCLLLTFTMLNFF